MPATINGHRMVSAHKAASLFLQIDEQLERVNQQLAHVVLAGPLTDEQVAYLQVALGTTDGLRKLFQAEAARQGCLPTTRRKE